LTEPAADQLHEPFRGLISARLDGQLAKAERVALSAHLARCADCRQVAHDFAEQRQLLRSLPSRLAPRNLWARTSAALDGELLRDARHGGVQPSFRREGRLAALTRPASVPSLLLVSATSLALATTLLITQLQPSLRLPDIGAPQATPASVGVALAFVGSDPGGLTLYRTHVDEGCASGDCPGQDAVEARVTFPASFEPSTLALDPQGNRLAIMGSDSQRENVFAVMDVPPLDGGVDDVPNRPRPPVPQSSSSPLDSSPTPPASLIVASLLPSATGSAAPASPTELFASTILDNVYGVGAAPAWSADGQQLAFSAMPSDGSFGPDIYVWNVGDKRARPITNDHRSYFASWSGSAIVVSRVGHADADLATDRPVLTTVAINLATHQQRTVGGPALWLPQVDPTGSLAVGWYGQLAWQGRQVVPLYGALYVIDWAALNPFGAAAPATTPESDLVDVGQRPTPAPVATPSSAPSSEPTVAVAPVDTPVPERTSPATERAPIASEAPTPTPLDSRLNPIDPARDPLQHPVTDWRVLWSADGRQLGEWTSDSAGSVWGQLTVLAVGTDGRLAGTPMLAATPATRGFNLTTNRVAWVAPLVGQRAGELRLRVWGPAGAHDVRVRPLDSTGVVAAF
jgi:hypothetical protein